MSPTKTRFTASAAPALPWWSAVEAIGGQTLELGIFGLINRTCPRWFQRRLRLHYPCRSWFRQLDAEVGASREINLGFGRDGKGRLEHLGRCRRRLLIRPCGESLLRTPWITPFETCSRASTSTTAADMATGELLVGMARSNWSCKAAVSWRMPQPTLRAETTLPSILVPSEKAFPLSHVTASIRTAWTVAHFQVVGGNRRGQANPQRLPDWKAFTGKGQLELNISNREASRRHAQGSFGVESSR